MFLEELSQAVQKKKKKKSICIESFYSNTSYGLQYKKAAKVNCLLKCLYNETRAIIACAQQMLVSSKTSATSKNSLTSQQETASIGKQLSWDLIQLEITQFFASHSLMSSTNNQAWTLFHLSVVSSQQICKIFKVCPNILEHYALKG